MASDSVGPGTMLGGDFRLLQPLSSGGMGALFVAEQLSTGRRRAVKVMHAGLLDSPALRERFAREARIGSLVRSDHVVEVVAAGVDNQTSAPWIAMELLEGEDLAAHVARRGALSPPAALSLLRPICHALGAAHSAGVVHRDIKPENVFIVSTKSAGSDTAVKVLDFGIAKIAAQMRTAHTGVIGTPLWMAPEQTDPSAEAGPPADVWAIGLLVFWLLTGRHYWRSAAVPSSSMHALMREILFDPMPPAQERARQLGLAERIPAGFDAWFARATERNPAARFADASEAFRALEPILSGTQSSVAQTSPPPAQQLAYPSGAPTLPAVGHERPRSRIWWLAVPVLGLGVLALAAAGIGAAYVAGVFDEPASVTPPVVTPPAAAPTASIASPVSTPAPPPHTATTKPAGTSSPPPAPKPSAAPPPVAAAPKPFDHAAAQKELAQRASFAKLSCSSRKGPRAFSPTVLFKNNGTVQRVTMSPQDMATDSGICVFGILSGTRIPAYDGPQQSSGVGVTLNN